LLRYQCKCFGSSLTSSLYLQEVHIIHTFPSDFYGAQLNLLIMGFIRPEYDYVTKELLIEDIMEDIEISKRSLGREGYAKYREDGFLWSFGEGAK
jgi:riboflavin kinase